MGCWCGARRPTERLSNEQKEPNHETNDIDCLDRRVGRGVCCAAGACLSLVICARAGRHADMKRVEAALLVPTDQCTVPCFWTFQAGTQTVADFKQVAVSVFQDAANDLVAPVRIVGGVQRNGVSLHAATIPNPILETPVDYVYVRVNPKLARAATVNLDQFSTTAIIGRYGAPNEAFLLFNARRPINYRLILLYSVRSAVYTIRGTFQSGKVCLTLDGVDALTLYRFANAAAAEKFVKDTAGTGGALPASISATVRRSASDLAQMAQNPTTNCLTVTQ